MEVAYDTYSGRMWNATEEDCLEFCELKRQTLNWTRFAACEYHEPQVYDHRRFTDSKCVLYGNNDHCASGGNSSHPGIFCYTYDVDGCQGTKL